MIRENKGCWTFDWGRKGPQGHNEDHPRSLCLSLNCVNGQWMSAKSHSGPHPAPGWTDGRFHSPSHPDHKEEINRCIWQIEKTITRSIWLFLISLSGNSIAEPAKLMNSFFFIIFILIFHLIFLPGFRYPR